MTVGGYRLGEEISRSGSSAVYRAWDTKLAREVALKILLSDGRAQRLERTRFEIEARTAARLKHPNVVQVYHVGEEGPLSFMVMDLVEGMTLADRLRSWGSFSPRHAVKLLLPLCNAVASAHGLGILHRDLSPASVTLTPAGEPLLSDFGAAGQRSSRRGGRRAGALGKPGYMAPEQARGGHSPVDERSDVYRLGALLYALLTGQAPFSGDSLPDTLSAVVMCDPTPPSSLSSMIDPALEALCLKCLAKVPDRRYQSAADLEDALQRYLDGSRSSPARGPALPEFSPRGKFNESSIRRLFRTKPAVRPRHPGSGIASTLPCTWERILLPAAAASVLLLVMVLSLTIWIS